VKFLLGKLAVIAVILSFLCLVSTSYAIGIGISPSEINIQNVLRGGYGEATIRVTNPNEFSLLVDLTKEDLIADWMIFAPKLADTIILTSGQIVTMAIESFTVPPESFYEFRVIVQPPADMPTGTYSGYINVDTTPIGNITNPEQTGTNIVTGAKLKASISITGDQILDYFVQGVSIKDTEESYPIELTVTGENRGNVRVSPIVYVDIWNRDMTEIVKSVELTGSEVLPTTTETHEFSIQSDNMSIGQYWVNVTISDGNEIIYEEVLTFDLMERGSLSIKGEFVGLVKKVWATVGEVVKIDALFKNIGELPTTAKYKGEVYLGSELTAVLESEELLVPVDETVNLTTYFTPDRPGRYVIRGAVYYDKKVTFTKEGILNVTEAESILNIILSNNLFYIGIIILLFILLVRMLPRKSNARYQKLDERLDKSIKDSEDLQKRIRESKKRFKK
jgi:hypothetical protein